MITVACVYWAGRFRGREAIYTPEWVGKLRNMVRQNLPVEHRFVCLTNSRVPCEKIPLKHNWPGWWSKIELFRPGLFENDRVLYLDLDTVIFKDLTPVVDFQSEFVFMGQPHKIPYGTKRIHPKVQKYVVYRYQSSVFAFNGGAGDALYENFGNEQMNTYRGDQDYISDVMPQLDTFPNKWMGKLEKYKATGPSDELIVGLCMGNGFPRKNSDFAQRYKWVKEVWR